MNIIDSSHCGNLKDMGKKDKIIRKDKAKELRKGKKEHRKT